MDIGERDLHNEDDLLDEGNLLNGCDGDPLDDTLTQIRTLQIYELIKILQHKMIINKLYSISLSYLNLRWTQALNRLE